MSLIKVIQDIAVKAVLANQPAEFCTGTVTQESPLEIMLSGETQLLLTEEFLVLTEPVVEKKITIDKHTHKIGSAVGTHTHLASGISSTLDGSPITPQNPPVATTVKIGPEQLPSNTDEPNEINADTEVVNTVINAVCTEHGADLPTDKNTDRIVVTINRKLEKGDKVLMLAVSSGQTYVILSRVFEHGGN